MTTDPLKIVDSEGEEMSLNKVDKALKSVGITLQDANGQFRNFDDVILELAASWDQIDTNTQRYIATVMAGNRQQSRFLAMVGNYERLAELSEEAANSEDAALVQYLKTMDSMDAKLNQLKTTFQEFYTSTGIEDLLKGTIDTITNIISRLNEMPKLFGTLPVAALATVTKIISGIKVAGNVLGPQVVKWFTDIKSKVQPIGLDLGKEYAEQIAKGIESKQQRIQNATENALRGNSSMTEQASGGLGEYVSRRSIREQAKSNKIKSFFDIFGTVLTGIGTILPQDLNFGFIKDDLGAAISGGGQILSGAIRGFAGDITGWLSVLTGVPTLLDGVIEETEEKIERLSKKVEETSNQALLSKNELKTLTDYKKKYEELAKEQYTSVEAKQEFLNLQNEIAEKYPELISGMTVEGTYLVDLSKKYETLYQEKKRVYDLDALSAQASQLQATLDADYQMSEYAKRALPNASKSNWTTFLGQFLFDESAKIQMENSVQEALVPVFKAYQKTNFLRDISQENIFWESVMENTPMSKNEDVDFSEATRADYERLKKIQRESSSYGADLLSYEKWENYFSGVDYLISSTEYFAQKYDASLKQTADTLLQIELPEETKIDDYQILFDQASEKIGEEWLQYLASLGEEVDIETALKNFSQNKVPQIVADFSNQIQDLDISEYNKKLQKANEIYTNSNLYSLDYLKTFTEQDTYLSDNQKEEILKKAIEAQEESKKQFTNIITQMIEKGIIENQESVPDKIENTLNQLSENSAKKYNDQIYNILNSISLSQESKVDTLTRLSSLLSDYKQAFSEEQYRQLEDILLSADFTSEKGLFDLETEIENLPFLKSGGFNFIIEDLINQIIPNFTVGFQSLADELTGSLEGFDEALQKASSGMSFSEASEMAKKLGISLDQFEEYNGQYYLENVSLVEQYLNTNKQTFNILNSKLTKILDNTKSEDIFNTIKDYASNEQNVWNTFTRQQQIETLINNNIVNSQEEAILYLDLYNQYYQDYAQNIADESITLGAYILQELPKLKADYLAASKSIKTAMLRTLITVGDFSTFLDLLGEEGLEKGDIGLSAEDRALIKSGNFDALSEEGKNLFSSFAESYITSFEKGKKELLDTINENIFKESPSIIGKTSQNEQLLAQLADLGIVEKYGEAAYQIIQDTTEDMWLVALKSLNLTQKEINSYMSDFIENKNIQVGSKSAKQGLFIEFIDNVNSLSIDLIERLTNNINATMANPDDYWSISDTIKNLNLELNADGSSYKGSYNNIKLLKSVFVSDFTAEIQDQINDYFNNIISIASSGISGSATNTEIETLQNYLNDQGADIELKTFKTAEGLKLTEESVYSIYYALSQIDAVAAQSLLEGISEQMEEWEGHSIDVATAMGKIKDLKEEIEDPNVNPARRKEAEKELAVWQQISKEKVKDEDNFDFMNNDIGDLQNPITFYESSVQAFEALSEASTSGYMGVEEYVNMIRFMGNTLSAEALDFAFKGKSASEAIQEGMNAIKGVDGELKVDMSGLTFGIDNLTEGMEGGIEEMAKAQIEWIDAQIAMLRGFEILEQMDFGETLNNDEANQLVDYVEDFIGVFSIGDLDLSTWLQGLDPTALATFFDQLNTIIHTYDPEEWETQITALINSLAEGLEIKVDPSRFEAGRTALEEALGGINLEDTVDPSKLDKEVLAAYQKAFNNSNLTKEDLIKMVPPEKKISWLELLTTGYSEGNQTTDVSFLEEGKEVNLTYNAEVGETVTTEELIKDDSGSFFSKIIKGAQQTASFVGELFGGSPENTLDTSSATASTKNLLIQAENATLQDSEGQTTNGENNLSEAAENLGALDSAAADAAISSEEAGTNLNILKGFVSDLSSSSKKSGSNIKLLTNAISGTSFLTSKYNTLANIVREINKLPSSSKTVTIGFKISSAVSKIFKFLGISSAKGNTALAKGSANNEALAAGTLMGELGPELVVAGGRYFVVGQNGAEFVNLPKDAIVFNHLQTKRLLESGHINSTGEPVTNERNAIAWATGNVNGGPAMASASDVIAQLLELRAFWQGILEMSAQDFSKAAGGGKGGGGGEDNKAYVADLERWYNLLRQIANLEQKITLEQAKRQNMTNGYDYVDSLEDELDYLKRQEKAYRDLSALQKSYYDTRRQDLLNSDYSKVFTYTSDGLMQYLNGEGRGLDLLAKLQETDANGQMKMNATEQLAYLESAGFDTSVLKVTKEGEDVDSETEMVQNFFDNVQAWMDELDGLYDSYNDALISVEEVIAAQNAIEQEYIDNQLSLEQQVLTAIIDREQAAIDAVQDEIDAIEKAADDFINGLNDTLKREKEMYKDNNTQAETERLQRQLAILQRSGGSASEIRALEEQLDSRYQDAYFDSMQEQIDAIQQASDNQIEKLQEQVDIATEALEYQKVNGLLWNEVYEIMNNWDANAITDFVMEFTKAFKEQSALQNQEQAKDTLMEAEKFKAVEAEKQESAYWQQYVNQAMEQYGQQTITNGYQSARDAYEETYKNTQGTAEQKHAAASMAANAALEKVKIELDKALSGPTGNTNTNDSIDGKKVTFLNEGDRVYTYTSETSTQKGEVLYSQGRAKEMGYKGLPTNLTLIKEGKERIQVSGTDGMGNSFKNIWIPKKYFAYSKGGLVDYTGLAMVHGTPQKPESYLNAEQTRELRNLLNEAKSLNSVANTISQLDELRQIWQAELSNQVHSVNKWVEAKNAATMRQESGGIVFEDVDINITSGVINNQTDAAQLGRTMWNEFVNVAKKTGNLTLSRR